MYLSKLEIFGFKSFAQKTPIKFHEGVTSIVGPNGCGKTNIVDAIRWCLGEQRSSTLRSDKMENVIFNGTSTRKPMGMAEVSLTIENTKGILPTEYTDVTITRRIFRSGESEYLLNKNICRLKDITNLFMDNRIVAALGLTHPELARPLLHIWNIMRTDLDLNRWNMAEHRWRNVTTVLSHGRAVRVVAGDTKGVQLSIFADRIEGYFWIEIDRDLTEGERALLATRYGHLEPRQMDALVRLVRALCAEYGIPPESVVPHNFVHATECPGARFP